MRDDSAQAHAYSPSFILPTLLYHNFILTVFCVNCKLDCFLALFTATLSTYLNLLIHYHLFFCFPMCKILWLCHQFSDFLCPFMVMSLNASPCSCVGVVNMCPIGHIFPNVCLIPWYPSEIWGKAISFHLGRSNALRIIRTLSQVNIVENEECIL